MTDNLSQKAINAALSGNWKLAIDINKNILAQSPNDTDALNRLARAFAETGNVNSAKKMAKKVVNLDPFNSIALKSLEKWKGLKKFSKSSSKTQKPYVFLEEPGKTKIVQLINICKENTISELDCGDELTLHSHGHNVNICTEDGKYVGRLPDDLSARLKKLIKVGNTYLVVVKNSNKDSVKVFLKELKRAEKVKDIPSFSADKIDYISFTSPDLVHGKKPPIVEEEEE